MHDLGTSTSVCGFESHLSHTAQTRGYAICGNSSVVELHLAKVDVAGSSPVSRLASRCITMTCFFIYLTSVKCFLPISTHSQYLGISAVLNYSELYILSFRVVASDAICLCTSVHEIPKLIDNIHFKTRIRMIKEVTPWK